MGLMTQKDMAQQEDGDVGTIRPWKKSMRETVEDAVGGFFGGDYWANKTAKNLTGLADFVPVVGDAAGAMDTVDSIDRGDYLGASIDGFATLLGVTPVVGPAVSKGVKSLKKPLKDALGAKPNSMGTKPDRNVANVESEKVLDKAKVGVENHSRILEDHGLREWDGVGSRADTFSFKNDKLEVYTGYSQEVDGKITRGYDTNVLSPNTTVKSIKRILGYDVGPAPKIAFERGDIGVNQALMGGDFLKKYGKDVISRMDTLASKATVYAQKDKLLSPIKDGTKVGVRLNLNSKVPDSPQGLDKLQTLHKNNFNGEVLSFQPYATVENAVFSVKPEGRQSISAKILGVDVPEAKGKYNAMSVDGTLAQSKNVISKGGKGVVEIGFNPMNNHLFIDMMTGQAVKGADVATVIGDRVYARGVKYWKKSEAPEVMDASDGTPLPSEVRYKFNKGGLVDAEMATLNFSHGGTVHGKVGASNVGADMLAKLISQNKQGDFKRRDAREDAREVMQAPQSTPVDDRPALDAAVIKMVQDHKRKQVVQAEEVPQSPQYSFDASLSSAADQAVDKLSVAVPSLGAIGESLLESGIDAGTDLASNVGDFLVGTYQDYKQRDLNTRTRLGSTYDDEMAGMDLVNKEVEKKEVEKVKPTTTFEADGFEHTLAAEGDKHHVDGGGVLTMSYGIVPDINSISLNGDPINPRTGHTFKVGSDLSKIDFSNATKTVRDVVIKRGDYTTDKEFANAVYTTMATKTKSNLESNKGFKSKWADLPREAKIALVDLDFNTGVGKATPTTEEEKGGSHWSDTALMATEMVKPLEDRSTANLIKFTQNFLDNGESPRGLLRRRLNAYNLVSKVEDKAVYTKQHKEVVADGVYKGKYRHDVFRADGTIIVSWYKVKSPATKADESVQRVVDGELFNELPVSPKPKQAAVDKTDWNRMIS